MILLRENGGKSIEKNTPKLKFGSYVDIDVLNLKS